MTALTSSWSDNLHSIHWSAEVTLLKTTTMNSCYLIFFNKFVQLSGNCLCVIKEYVALNYKHTSYLYSDLGHSTEVFLYELDLQFFTQHNIRNNTTPNTTIEQHNTTHNTTLKTTRRTAQHYTKHNNRNNTTQHNTRDNTTLHTTLENNNLHNMYSSAHYGITEKTWMKLIYFWNPDRVIIWLDKLVPTIKVELKQ